MSNGLHIYTVHKFNLFELLFSIKIAKSSLNFFYLFIHSDPLDQKRPTILATPKPCIAQLSNNSMRKNSKSSPEFVVGLQDQPKPESTLEEFWVKRSKLTKWQLKFEKWLHQLMNLQIKWHKLGLDKLRNLLWRRKKIAPSHQGSTEPAEKMSWVHNRFTMSNLLLWRSSEFSPSHHSSVWSTRSGSIVQNSGPN